MNHTPPRSAARPRVAARASRPFAPLALALALCLTPGAPAMAQGAPPVDLPPPPLDNPGLPLPMTPSEVVANAPPSDWVAIPATDLLVMQLAPDARGRARRVVIQLMPAPFSQGWVANIRTLATAHWWDGLSINRVQDNYVVQWGDADGEDAAKARALPAGLAMVTESDYVTTIAPHGPFASVEEVMRAVSSAPGDARDSYAERTSFFGGWPIALQQMRGERKALPDGEIGEVAAVTDMAWPIHCYGMVGVGRGLSPDTGSGAELYTVIGHAPRHLDRNIAVVGRVVEGIENLSSLPRGTGPLGFYEMPEERVAISSVRLAAELPAAEQPHLQYLGTNSGSFLQYADARANRRDAFFNVPAGGADICNIPVPIRRAPLR
jgi:peptidylprolyl isomerase